MAMWLLYVYLACGVVLTGRYLIETGRDIACEKGSWQERTIRGVVFPFVVVAMIVFGPITKWLLWPFVIDPIIGWAMSKKLIRLKRKILYRIDQMRAQWRAQWRKFKLPAG